MKKLSADLRAALLCGALCFGAAITAQAADQTVPGAGNDEAIRLSKGSPLVQSAFDMLRDRLRDVRSNTLRDHMAELMDHERACVQHRASLTADDKSRIISELAQAKLVDMADDAGFPGGVRAGIFPPVLADGTACPRMPQAFFSAPGGATFGHHSEPGGLPVHEAFNDTSALGLAHSYHAVYGHTGPNGLPVVVRERADNEREGKKTDAAFVIDSDTVLAAPMWHDWAKTMVFQWNADGTEFAELNFGGNGATDNNGQAGNSKTGAHHILGLAEAMKRGLAPDFVIAVASAHSVPTLGNEYKVVNWLRAAAIIAQIDPYKAGYLTRDARQNPRLPAVRRLGDVDLMAAPQTQTNMLVEYVLHNLSDADYAFTGAAATDVSFALEKLAAEYGYDPTTADYLRRFRNPVLTYLSAERLYILYSNGGLDAVRKEIGKLRKLAVI
ncbi:MAG: hypothetical protein JSS56_17690 [Proteobacteria bacterium]|nr:hypothetical protein [Pseudomonadota bacterium]